MNVIVLIIYCLLLIGAVYIVADLTDGDFIAMFAIIAIYTLGYLRGVCV